MTRIPVGDRIRSERKRRGMSQGELARRLDVSPGYLSLIENDKRQIGGSLMRRIAEILDVDVRRLSATSEGRLAADLGELARALDMAGCDEKSAAALVGVAPAWAKAMIRLWRELEDERVRAEALSERVSRDPELVALSHRIFSQITAIRSFAEILSDYDNLDRQELKRFAEIVANQSADLTSSAREMMTCLRTDPGAVAGLSPAREVEDFLMDHGNHFPAIEAEVARILPALEARGGPLEIALAERLEADHGIHVERARAGAPCCAAGAARYALPADLPAATVRFRLARRLVEAELRALLDRLSEDPRLTGDEARARARSALARYGAGCLVLPYDRVLEAAETTRYDVDAIAARFGASFEQVAHRLVTLRRPDAEGIPFAFMRTDPAGNVSKRYSIPGLRMPHVSGACPLWVVYAAFTTPGETRTQMVEMPGGERFLFVARHIRKATTAFGRPPVQFSVMLGCDSAFADRTVYGDAFQANRDSLVTPAGFDCRSCRRTGCAQRAYQPALAGMDTTGLAADPASGTAAEGREAPPRADAERGATLAEAAWS